MDGSDKGGTNMNPSKDFLKLTGTVVIERRKKNGKVIDRENMKNLIVNVGKEHVAKLIGGLVSGISEFQSIAIGTGTTGVSASDTSLETEITRALATKAYEADYKATFEYTFSFGSGVTHNITEAGLFDSNTESGSTMLDRFTFTAKEVDADTDLYIKITITVSS